MSPENRVANQLEARDITAHHVSARAVEVLICTHLLLPQLGQTPLKEGSNEIPLAIRTNLAGPPTSSLPRTRPMNRHPLVQPAWRFRLMFRRTANEPHEDPRHLTAENKHSQRLADTVEGCSRLAPEAAQTHLLAQCHRLATVVLPELRLPRYSIPDNPRRLETRMIRTPRASGRHNKASIPASSLLGRRNRAFLLIRRRLVCRRRWEKNGSRTKALFTAGTVQWPT